MKGDQLAQFLAEWGITYSAIAKKIGMPKTTFSNKMSPRHFSSFTAEEYKRIQEVLFSLKNEINKIYPMKNTETKKIETLKSAGVEVIDSRSTTGVICAKVNGSVYTEETVAKLYQRVMRKIA